MQCSALSVQVKAGSSAILSAALDKIDIAVACLAFASIAMQSHASQILCHRACVIALPFQDTLERVDSWFCMYCLTGLVKLKREDHWVPWHMPEAWNHTAMVGGTVCNIESLDPIEAPPSLPSRMAWQWDPMPPANVGGPAKPTKLCFVHVQGC